MSGPLGCAREYQAVIQWRGGARNVFALEPVTDVMWQRRLNGQSIASVTLAKPAVSTSCCELLGQISPWAHELAIYRAGRLVWQGPVLQPLETRNEFVVNAVDITGWFDVRAAVTSYVYSETVGPVGVLPPTDAVVIAQRLLGDAFPTTDDTNIRPYWQFTTGGVVVEQAANARVDMVGDLFEDLTKGLDYTTIGRRLIVTPPGRLSATTRGVTTLSDEQLGGGVEVSVEGSVAATQVFNHPSGGDAETPIGSAGGRNAYYGLVQRSEELNAWSWSQSSMNALARQSLDRSFPAPLMVRLGDEATLNPDAPIGVDDLLCGVRIDVVLGTGWCRQVRAMTRLVAVTGTWGEADERIAVSLEELGGATLPGLFGDDDGQVD